MHKKSKYEDFKNKNWEPIGIRDKLLKKIQLKFQAILNNKNNNNTQDNEFSHIKSLPYRIKNSIIQKAVDSFIFKPFGYNAVSNELRKNSFGVNSNLDFSVKEFNLPYLSKAKSFLQSDRESKIPVKKINYLEKKLEQFPFQNNERKSSSFDFSQFNKIQAKQKNELLSQSKGELNLKDSILANNNNLKGKQILRNNSQINQQNGQNILAKQEEMNVNFNNYKLLIQPLSLPEQQKQRFINNRENMKKIQTQNNESFSETSSKKSIYMAVPGEVNDEWALINKFQGDQYKKFLIKQKVDKIKNTNEYRKLLNDQLLEKKRKEMKEKQDLENYLKQERVLLTEYDKNEQIKIKNRQQELLNDLFQNKSIQRQNLQNSKNQKRNDQKERKMLQKTYKQDYDNLLKQSQEEKAQQKETWLKFMRDGEHQAQQRKLEIEKQRYDDKLAERQFSQIEEEKEQRKQQEFQNRIERQRQILKNNEQVYNEKFQAESFQQKIINDNAANFVQMQNDLDRQEKLNIINNKSKLRDSLANQIIERKKQQKIEEELNQKQKIIWQKSLDEFVQNNEKEKQMQQQFQLNYAQVLENQIQQKNKGMQMPKMTKQELLYNKETLKQLHENFPNKFSKLQINQF